MDSPIKWIGGKSLSASKIVDFIPVHQCYVEPFFGAGWVFFKKQPSKVEVINDIDSELMNLFKVVQRSVDKFKEREKYELYSSELYYEYRNDYNSGKHFEFDDVERAFRFFCIIRESFSGRFGGGWGYSASKNEATVFFNTVRTIDEVSLRLKNCQIDNRDFETVIKSYDNEDAKVFYFIDPPYMKSNNKLLYRSLKYKDFTVYDHQRLYNCLKNLKGKFLLTIDDSYWVRERYCNGDFIVVENKVLYSSGDSNNRRYAKELIIMNYDYKREKRHGDQKQSILEF